MRVSLYSFCCPAANFFSNHRIASSSVSTPYSSLSLTSFRLATVYFIASTGPAMDAKISRSLLMPRARINSTTGIAVVPALGILTISIPSRRFSMLIGLRTPSRCEKIFATSVSWAYFLFFSTVTRLGARSSIEIRTLSVPLMIKYPPGSRGSSPAFRRSWVRCSASSEDV